MYYNISKLKEVLENHAVYLRTGEIFMRADLYDADLSGAKLPEESRRAENTNG